MQPNAATKRREQVGCAACGKRGEAVRMGDGTLHNPYAWLAIGVELVCPNCQYEIGLFAERLAAVIAAKRNET